MIVIKQMALLSTVVTPLVVQCGIHREDGGGNFLRNAGYQTYKASQPSP
jgi:hypothetical protein